MRSLDAIRIRLKSLMKQHNLNYNELSMKCGMPRSTVKTFFYHKIARSVTVYTVSMFCHGLGITLTEFFDDDIFKYVNDIEVE